MEKIASFTIDHVKLVPGIYVSRKDPVGGTIVTTFDIRITSPNNEPVMNTAELHAMEHLQMVVQSLSERCSLPHHRRTDGLSETGLRTYVPSFILTDKSFAA